VEDQAEENSLVLLKQSLWDHKTCLCSLVLLSKELFNSLTLPFHIKIISVYAVGLRVDVFDL
jgi:hypothetical protein